MSGKLHRLAPPYSHVVAVPVGLQGPFGVLPAHEGHEAAVRISGLIVAFDKILIQILFSFFFNFTPDKILEKCF